MSPARRTRLLLRSFPSGWRSRYGEELAVLIEQSEGDESSLRVSLDLVSAGLRERFRSLLPGRFATPGERVRSGALLALCAWVLFVLAGADVQKASEQWEDVTPLTKQQLPAAAFSTLQWAAFVGSLFVLAGIAAALPSLVAFLRGGGWPFVRRPILRAFALSLPALLVAVIASSWAHRLSSAQRNGGDLAYSGLFAFWALLVAISLFAWAGAAVATARRLDLSQATLRLEAWLSLAVALTMGVMTIATVTWWASLADVAPWFFSGARVGSNASALDPKLVLAGTLMLAATAFALVGARAALRAAPRLGDRLA